MSLSSRFLQFPHLAFYRDVLACSCLPLCSYSNWNPLRLENRRLVRREKLPEICSAFGEEPVLSGGCIVSGGCESVSSLDTGRAFDNLTVIASTGLLCLMLSLVWSSSASSLLEDQHLLKDFH